MGAVYAAVHTSIERRVAIKVLHPEFAVRPEFVGRFFNEARAVNRVDHPGLVQISDYGQQPDGTAYIVMEYLRGQSLNARLKQEGALRVREALRLGFLIADALAAAHQAGIVHRDLKPDNIMIVADPNIEGGERTKLLDFGIAKLTEGGEIVKTKTDAVMGTPVYMSPEQCRGAGGVDDRSDVYALGVMLFDMLAGGPPFTGAGFGEIIAQHLFQEPPSLSKLAPDLPAPVVALVMRLLVKDKSRRPTMREVAAELSALSKKASDKPRVADVVSRRAGRGEPSATPVLSSEQVTRTAPGQRRNWQLGLGIGLALLSVASVSLVLWRASRPTAVPSAAVQSPAPEKPAAQEPRTWRIDSEPPGASVWRVDDNTLLCQTPCLRQEASRAGTVRLRLQRAGYLDRTIQVDATQAVQRHEILDAAPAEKAAVGKAAVESPRGATESGGKSSRGTRATTASATPTASGSASSAGASSSGKVDPSSAAKNTERVNARPKIED